MAAATKPNGRGPRVPLVNQLPPAPDLTPAGTASLDAAVLRVQAQAGKLIRNEPGQVGSRTYMYVTLTAVTDEVLPLLVAEDLLWKAWPTVLDDGKPGLRYRMTHIPSGERDEDVMPLLTDPTMQGLGSGITYGRRYALTAYLNLTIDEDDDGASANRPPVDRYADTRQNEVQNAEQSAEPPRPQAKPAKASERPITANQRDKLLRPRAKEAGLSAGEFANVILAACAEPPRVWRTEEHASQTLARLLDRLPARLKDAVLEGIAAAKDGGGS